MSKANCSSCNSDLCPHQEVTYDPDYILYFCDRDCANQFYKDNPDTLTDCLDNTYTPDDFLTTRILTDD